MMKMKLPPEMDYIKVCWACKGEGEYRQLYNLGCGQGMAEMMGDCDYCKRTGFLVTGTMKPPTSSVLRQIKVWNENNQHSDA